MAGQGTGLPTTSGTSITPNVSLRGFGAGEAAAADAFDQAAQGLGRLVDIVEPAAQQAMTTKAQQDADAGQFNERMLITGADAAYNQALRQGTANRLNNARDADIDKARIDFAYRPDEYASWAANYRADALKATVPGAMAIDWANDFDRVSNNALATIRSARAQSDLTESRNNTFARIDRLTTETIDAAQGRALGEVLADDGVQGNLLQIRLMYDGLEQNPAFGLSPEEIGLKRQETIARVKAGAITSSVLNTYRTEGIDAALVQLQQLQTDESLGLSREETTLATAAARNAVNLEKSLAEQRINEAESVRVHAERELGRQIDEDVGLLTLTGKGSGLTEEQVRAVGGNAGVARWYKARADAQEFHELVGDLSSLGPEEAASRIAQRTATRGLSALPIVSDAGDLATLADAIMQVESGGVNGLVSRAPSGPGGGGAYGVMQVLPDTARQIAGQLGIPFDAERLRTDRAYNQQIGRRHLQNLLTRYNGDSFLATTAYHAGQGTVDAWIKPVGTVTQLTLNGRQVSVRGRGDPRSGQISREAWLSSIEQGNPHSAAYPRKVLAALGAGRANAAWDAYQGQRTARAADPVSTVQTDFAVKAAQATWAQGGYRRSDQGQAMVQTNLDAQDRAGIPNGQRRTLTVGTLAQLAQPLMTAQQAGDTAAYQAATQTIVRRFGNHGARVVQDVLEIMGDSRFSAQIQAQAAGQVVSGQPPAPQQQAQAQTAARTTQMNRTANGSAQSAGQMADEQLRAALGASPL